MEIERVRQVPWYETTDERGVLSSAEFPQQLPFITVRCFVVRANSLGRLRGGHAHHQCRQVLFAIQGRIKVTFEDLSGSGSFVLEGLSKGLYIPPLTWATQEYLDSDSTLLVLASHPYDPNDYIVSAGEAAAMRGVTFTVLSRK